MTINNIRKRLFPLVQDILNDPFRQKYEMLAPQISEEQAPSFLEKFQDLADAYICLASDNIQSKEHLLFLAQIADPMVVYAVYMRYYLISKYLESQPQEQEISVSSSDTDFIADILINYWPTCLSGLSK